MASESKNGADPSGSEFARFETLLKRLIDVPKAEVDAAVKKAKRSRERSRRRPARS